MRLHEVVNQAVGYVNSNLLTESPDYHDVRSGKLLTASHSALLEPRNGKQRLISATVKPYDITLVHPKRASASDIFIRSHKGVSKLRFQEEGGWEIRPIDLCIGLREMETWWDLAYVVAKGSVFAVSPPDRQTIDFDSSQGSSTNVIYVNRAYPNESLAVVRIAQKAIRSYRDRQRYYSRTLETNRNK